MIIYLFDNPQSYMCVMRSLIIAELSVCKFTSSGQNPRIFTLTF